MQCHLGLAEPSEVLKSPRASASLRGPAAGYGYPALIAFNPSKSKYASLRSAFEETHVKQFLDSVRLVSWRRGPRVARASLHPSQFSLRVSPNSCSALSQHSFTSVLVKTNTHFALPSGAKPSPCAGL